MKRCVGVTEFPSINSINDLHIFTKVLYFPFTTYESLKWFLIIWNLEKSENNNLMKGAFHLLPSYPFVSASAWSSFMKHFLTSLVKKRKEEEQKLWASRAQDEWPSDASKPEGPSADALRSRRPDADAAESLWGEDTDARAPPPPSRPLGNV